MRRFLGALALSLCLLGGEPSSARVLGDATVAYSAERVLTVNGQSFMGRIFSIPGHQRHEQNVAGFQQVAIFDLDAGRGYFILPALMSYVDFRIAGALAELSAPDITGAPAGTETVGGIATAKYKVRKRASDGTLIEGAIWLSAAGIPMRADGAVTDGNGIRTAFSWALSHVRLGAQDPAMFSAPVGLYRLPEAALPGFLGGQGG
ncbi:MAG TPA: hypothetical protein VMU06_00390 [Stellaceae bacterium]|nr:hypothetical protein [Stellaceae bacterium]